MEKSVETPRPSNDDIGLLPAFERLPRDRIHLVRGIEQESFVVQELARTGIAGFDTETKPVFVPSSRPDGPHVVQLATLEHAFIFQVFRSSTLSLLKEILESPHLLKVGFGLKSDKAPLHRKLGINMQTYVDVTKLYKPLGFRQPVGIKAAVAITLGQCLQKSKSATKSNWAMHNLSPSQMQYASDDAHAALAVYLALGCPAALRREVGPNPSLERTSTGLALGPRTGSGHHPLRGPSANPVGSAQLKR